MNTCQKSLHGGLTVRECQLVRASVLERATRSELVSDLSERFE